MEMSGHKVSGSYSSVTVRCQMSGLMEQVPRAAHSNMTNVAEHFRMLADSLFDIHLCSIQKELASGDSVRLQASVSS